MGHIIMGVVDNLMGSGKSGFYLGITAVVGIITYTWIRGSGLPIVGNTGTNGSSDVFGGY